MRFKVRTVASYAPTEPAGGLFDTGQLFVSDETKSHGHDVRKRIFDWVSETDGRRSSWDHSIDPPRLTVEAWYDVDAPSEWEAEVDGRSLFREESEAANRPEPETVVAHVEDPDELEES